MWRCGAVEYFGADAPEEEIDLDEYGVPTFWRAPMIGAPFRDLEFDENEDPIAVCTPSTPGRAESSAAHAVIVAVLSLAVALAWAV